MTQPLPGLNPAAMGPLGLLLLRKLQLQETEMAPHPLGKFCSVRFGLAESANGTKDRSSVRPSVHSFGRSVAEEGREVNPLSFLLRPLLQPESDLVRQPCIRATGSCESVFALLPCMHDEETFRRWMGMDGGGSIDIP